MNDMNCLVQIAQIFTGIGAFLTGFSACILLPKHLGYKKKLVTSKEEVQSLHNSLKLMFPLYKKYMASQEGIVWQDYPKDSGMIIKGISTTYALEEDLVQTILDELFKEGKI